jgi:hypothetical protein
MDKIKIPKFENEADEANWAYENRDRLSAAFHQAVQEGRVRHGTLKRRARVEAALEAALKSKEIVVTAEELSGRGLVSVLREKLKSK